MSLYEARKLRQIDCNRWLFRFLVGFLGSLFTNADSLNNWYANLNKPAFNPPSWVFGPVWTTLYILMGIAAFFGLAKRSRQQMRPPGTTFIRNSTRLERSMDRRYSLVCSSPLLGLIDIVLLLFCDCYDDCLFL